MPGKRTLTYAAMAVALAVVIVGAVVATDPSILNMRSSTNGGSGALNIYLTDAPPSSQTLKYLLVNVSSVELRYQGNVSTTATTTSSASPSSASPSVTSTTASQSVTTTSTSSASAPQNVYVFNVPSHVGMNVNLTTLHGQSLLLGAVNVPAGSITGIVINITGAKAFYTDGSTDQLKVVADGKLMIPIQSSILANGSTDLTIDITPNLVHISQGGVLTPVVHVNVVEKGPSGVTKTHTASVDESSAA